MYTQVLPILSMVITLLLIQRNVNFDDVPGFDKLSGLIMVITAALVFMWIIDKTRIIVFSYVPFHQVLLLFAGLMVVIRFGWKRIFSNDRKAA